VTGKESLKSKEWRMCASKESINFFKDML